MEPPQLHSSGPRASFFAEAALVCGSVAALNVVCGASRVKIALLVASGAVTLRVSRLHYNEFQGNWNQTPSVVTETHLVYLGLATHGILCLYDLADCFSLFRWPSKQRLAALAVDLCRYGGIGVVLLRIDQKQQNLWSVRGNRGELRRQIRQLRNRRELVFDDQTTERQLHLNAQRRDRMHRRQGYTRLLSEAKTNEAQVKGTPVPDLVIKRVLQNMSFYRLLTKMSRVNRAWCQMTSEELVRRLKMRHPLTDIRFSTYRPPTPSYTDLPPLDAVTLLTDHIPAIRDSARRGSLRPFHIRRFLESPEDLRLKEYLLSWRPDPSLALSARPGEKLYLVNRTLDFGAGENWRSRNDKTPVVQLAFSLRGIANGRGVTDEEVMLAKILMRGADSSNAHIAANLVRTGVPIASDANAARLLRILEGKPLTKMARAKEGVRKLGNLFYVRK